MSLAQPLAFPGVSPAGYAPLEREPTFDPARHLALEKPETVVSLEELGYGPEEIAECPTTLGITSCFRVLSDEGVACLLEVVRSLERFTTSNARIERNVRGGTYRSRFLRDLCLSPDIAEAISEICDAPMAPHTIPHQLGHLNYNPLDIGRSVDKWHVDTLRVDYVMFVTDPNAVEGGEFQYFAGTKHEMAALHEAGDSPPADRVVSPRLPGPGHAVLQQGNMVVHRARGIREPGERVTMVNGYVPMDLRFPDFTRYDQLVHADPPDVVTAEYERHVAWLARERARAIIDSPDFTDDREASAARLGRIAEELDRAATLIRSEPGETIEHFGDG